MSFVTRRKPVEAEARSEGSHHLRQTLSWPHLVALGVGAIIGTGIYTLIGVGAGQAGPAVILSFAIAGAVCAFAALCYAEMATLMPQAGSAYTYSYAGMGELVGWIIGWSLILEYTVVCSTVAVGWSGYAQGFLVSHGWGLPAALAAGPWGEPAGLVNLPAVAITLVVTGMLLVGTRESATVNFYLVIFKVVALVAFVALTLPGFDPSHFHPFMPYGFNAHVDPDGVKRGVMAAAAVIFFAFYGFDAISTAAEEAKNPSRDLTIGIVGSMLACAVIYMIVAAAALGASPFNVFAKSGEPLAFILREMGHPLASVLIAAAAVIALPTVIMAFMFGQSRVFFAMSRDGLLPRGLSAVNRRGVPAPVTLMTGICAALMAGFLPLKFIAEVANAGTLAAFIATAIAMMVLRRQRPELPRPFRTPLWWLVGPLAVAGCLYLFWSLADITKVLFFAWNALGVGVYLAYGRTKSRLAVA
ncbi:amino acid permease [Phenylobacterium hankyongense]|uniref:Amino acid permease n=1 Tax=Phenylobacterium hankyongense TaxID=1813876 RepID=A0A328AZX9_9CAUL|nr:amino acid permease [Phenylobacterium hankyongense]RAK59236.1 amino acid permease [Phenylobacterium hankyongense]